MRTDAGPKLPDHEVAKIGGTFKFLGLGAHTVLLQAIDDVPVTEGDVEVLPGLHTVSVIYSSAVLNTEFHGVAPCFISFRAEAGNSYIANGDASYETWRCWIDDTQTQERTSGTFIRPADWNRRPEQPVMLCAPAP